MPQGRLFTDAINIAVGTKSFVEKVKSLLGFKAKGRDVIEGIEMCHLREEAAPRMTLFRAEKDDIVTENAYFGDVNTE
jgi:hypothetical protein